MRSPCPRSVVVGDRLHLDGVGFSGREIHPECSAFSRLAVYRDRTLVVLDDSVDNRETRSGALPGPFRGEERLKNTLDNFPAHTATRVAQDHSHVVAGAKIRGCARQVLIDHQMVKLDP